MGFKVFNISKVVIFESKEIYSVLDFNIIPDLFSWDISIILIEQFI